MLALEMTGALGVGFEMEEELRGFGVLAEKSALLSPVSVAPDPARKMAVVVEGAGAAAPS